VKQIQTLLLFSISASYLTSPIFADFTTGDLSSRLWKDADPNLPIPSRRQIRIIAVPCPGGAVPLRIRGVFSIQVGLAMNYTSTESSARLRLLKSNECSAGRFNLLSETGISMSVQMTNREVDGV
jgi:hypothetical protein